MSITVIPVFYRFGATHFLKGATNKFDERFQGEPLGTIVVLFIPLDRGSTDGSSGAFMQKRYVIAMLWAGW
jgi:hypothetical protein